MLHEQQMKQADPGPVLTVRLLTAFPSAEHTRAASRLWPSGEQGWAQIAREARAETLRTLERNRGSRSEHRPCLSGFQGFHVHLRLEVMALAGPGSPALFCFTDPALTAPLWHPGLRRPGSRAESRAAASSRLPG